MVKEMIPPVLSEEVITEKLDSYNRIDGEEVDLDAVLASLGIVGQGIDQTAIRVLRIVEAGQPNRTFMPGGQGSVLVKSSDVLSALRLVSQNSEAIRAELGMDESSSEVFTNLEKALDSF